MAEPDFDPYYKWLGIPRKHQPPNHYRLLGLELLEDDAEVIHAAAARHLWYLRQQIGGQRSALAEQLIAEVERAETCLTDPAAKASYDSGLKTAGFTTQTGADSAPQQEGTSRGEPAAQEVGEGGTTPFNQIAFGAAEYLLLSARRWWIRRVRLTQAYRALGRDAYASRRYPEQLGVLYTKLVQLDRRLFPPESPSQPPPQKAWERAIRWPVGVVHRIARWGWDFSRQRLLTQVGRFAFPRDCAAGQPADLLQPIKFLEARAAKLESRMERLATPIPGRWLNARRLARLTVLAVVLVVAFSSGVLTLLLSALFG